MLSSNSSALRGKAAVAPSSRFVNSVRPVQCQAKTAWAAWDTYLKERKPVTKPGAKEAAISSEIGSSLKTIAATYKPHFSAATSSIDGVMKVQHIEKVVPVPADLHAKLEAIGQQQLKNVLGQDMELDAASVSYTTTDVNGALCIVACTAQQGVDKIAHVALVACETERQASWSRLEGLLLHWGCTEGLGAPWCGAPSGWTAVPSKIVDAGSAQECMFDKKAGAGAECLYTMELQLPLRGSLKSGGISFVLKAKDAQNTKWLKDASTNRDFFLDLQLLPVVKI